MTLSRALKGPHRFDLAALLALGALALLAFAPALPAGRVLFERDIANYWYPQVETFVRTIAEGSAPLWNGRFSFGQPMWEDPAFQVAYPPTWLNLVLLPAAYFKLFAIGHCWIAGAGLYVFLRRLGLGPLSAFLGGATWCLSGPLLSATSMYNHYATAAWMGFVLAALVSVLDGGGRRAALGLGALAGLESLGGSAEVVLMTAALAVAVMLARPRPQPGHARRVGVALAISGLLAALIAAVQWLPTILYVRHSGSRLQIPPDFNVYWSLHPASIADVFAFRVVADLPWSTSARSALFEGREPFLVSLYLGVPALALALLAALRRDRRALVFSGLGLLFFAVALGRHTPLAPWLVRARILAMFRFPVKAMFGVAVTAAILAAFGLDLWQRPWDAADRRRARIVAGLAAAIALVAALGAGAVARGVLDPRMAASAVAAARGLASARLLLAMVGAAAAAALLWLRARGAEPRRLGTGLIVGAVVLDLGLAAARTNPGAPAELLIARPPLLASLGPTPDHARVQVFGESMTYLLEQLTRGPRGWESEWRWTLGHQEMLTPPDGARWRLDGAFDGNVTGLTPEPIPFLSSVVRQPGHPFVSGRLLRVAGVDYVVTLSSRDISGLTEVGSFPSVFETPIHLYRVAEPSPRVFLVSGVRVALDAESATRVLVDPAFDPAREVVLAEGGWRPPAADFEGDTHVVWRRANRWIVETSATDAAVLVIADAWVPGWRARVDGADVPVVRANAAFRGVRVPAGRHRVEMWYFPASIAGALACAAAAALLAGGVLLITRGGRA